MSRPTPEAEDYELAPSDRDLAIWSFAKEYKNTIPIKLVMVKLDRTYEDVYRSILKLIIRGHLRFIKPGKIEAIKGDPFPQTAIVPYSSDKIQSLDNRLDELEKIRIKNEKRNAKRKHD